MKWKQAYIINYEKRAVKIPNCKTIHLTEESNNGSVKQGVAEAVKNSTFLSSIWFMQAMQNLQKHLIWY